MTDDDILDAIARREGGYSDRPDDRGGPTKYGVTRATLEAWRGRLCTAADVMALTVAEARTILRVVYIILPRFDRIEDDRLRALVVDWGVNSSPARATRYLQRVLGVAADGVLGPLTLAAIAARDAADLYRRVTAERVRFIGRTIRADPTQVANAEGWCNRAAEFVEIS